MHLQPGQFFRALFDPHPWIFSELEWVDHWQKTGFLFID